MKKVVCVLLMAGLAVPVHADSKGRKKVAVIAGLGLLGAAIAGHRAAKRSTMVTLRGSASEPEFGAEAFARPGEAVYATYNYDEVRAYSTTEMYFTPDGAARPAPQNFYRMVSGKYCKPNGKECVGDSDNDGDLDKAGRSSDGKKIDVPYEKEIVRFPFDGGFRTELLYLGRANGVLRLQYREFIDDLARPAFSQELSYQVDEFPAVIYFQNLEVEISEAGNSGISYRALEATN